MSADLEARLTDLEIRYTHEVEKTTALSEVIVAQGKRLDALEKRVVVLEQALRSVSAGEAVPNEPPPHY